MNLNPAAPDLLKEGRAKEEKKERMIETQGRAVSGKTRSWGLAKEKIKSRSLKMALKNQRKGYDRCFTA